VIALYLAARDDNEDHVTEQQQTIVNKILPWFWPSVAEAHKSGGLDQKEIREWIEQSELARVKPSFLFIIGWLVGVGLLFWLIPADMLKDQQQVYSLSTLFALLLYGPLLELYRRGPRVALPSLEKLKSIPGLDAPKALWAIAATRRGFKLAPTTARLTLLEFCILPVVFWLIHDITLRPTSGPLAFAPAWTSSMMVIAAFLGTIVFGWVQRSLKAGSGLLAAVLFAGCLVAGMLIWWPLPLFARPLLTSWYSALIASLVLFAYLNWLEKYTLGLVERFLDGN